MSQVDFTQIDAIELQVTGIGPADALKKTGDGRFTRPRATDQSQHRSGRNLEADIVQRLCRGTRINEVHINKGQRPLDPRTHAGGQSLGLCRLVQHGARFAKRGGHLVQVIEQLGEVRQRGCDTTTEHHKGDERARTDGSRVCQHQIGADKDHATVDEHFQRHAEAGRPVGHTSDIQLGLHHASRALIPLFLAGGFKGEGLDGADAGDGFIHHAGALHLRLDKLADLTAYRPHEDDDQKTDEAGSRNGHPGQRRAQIEQERQDDDQREHVEECRHETAGHEVTDLVDGHDATDDITGLLTLEELKGQRQQTVEQMQRDPGVDTCRQDEGQLAPAVGQQDFIE